MNDAKALELVDAAMEVMQKKNPETSGLFYQVNQHYEDKYGKSFRQVVVDIWNLRGKVGE